MLIDCLKEHIFINRVSHVQCAKVKCSMLFHQHSLCLLSRNCLTMTSRFFFIFFSVLHASSQHHSKVIFDVNFFLYHSCLPRFYDVSFSNVKKMPLKVTALFTTIRTIIFVVGWDAKSRIDVCSHICDQRAVIICLYNIPVQQ